MSELEVTLQGLGTDELEEVAEFAEKATEVPSNEPIAED